MRVFKLGTDAQDVQVIFDPWAQMVAQKLPFEYDGIIVTPVKRRANQ